jgi:hypothetical protein
MPFKSFLISNLGGSALKAGGRSKSINVS